MNGWKAARVAGALATLGLLGAVSVLAQDDPPTPVEVSTLDRRNPQRIALIPVIVHSSEDPGYLRDGLRDMLVSRLEQDGTLQVVLADRKRATTNVDAALATGRELNADYVLFGSFTRFGQGASLDMQCAATRSVEGRPPLRQIFVHAGDIAAMIPDLDELVGKVNRFIASFVEDVATSAPPADGLGQGLDVPGGTASASEAPVPSLTTEELLRRIEALEDAVRQLGGEP